MNTTKKISELFKLLDNEPSRIIIEYLEDNGPKAVIDIAVHLNHRLKNTKYRRKGGVENCRTISSSSTTQFLKPLKIAGIIGFTPKGASNLHFVTEESKKFIEKISNLYETEYSPLISSDRSRPGYFPDLPVQNGETGRSKQSLTGKGVWTRIPD